MTGSLTGAGTALPAGDDGQSAFGRFLAGEEIARATVAESVAACLPGATLEACSFGYWRKAVARVRDPGGGLHYAKVAFHAFSAGLLAAEAAGFDAAAQSDAFEIPAHRFRRLSDSHAVSVTSALDGRAPAPFAALRPARPPFADAPERIERLRDYAAALTARLDRAAVPEAARARSLVGRLSAAAPDDAIAVAPSHGDFVYWNTLERPGARPVLLDFEYYARDRVAGFDAVYWRMLPLLRFAVRKRLPHACDSLLSRCIRAPAAAAGDGLSGEARLAACLLEHATRMIGEHRHADIDALIGSEARARRDGIIARQLAIAERLLA